MRALPVFNRNGNKAGVGLSGGGGGVRTIVLKMQQRDLVHVVTGDCMFSVTVWLVEIGGVIMTSPVHSSTSLGKGCL